MAYSKKQKARSKKNFENNIKSSYYESLIIEDFKVFKKIKFENFKKINIFLGANNSGKTSLLEAVFAHASGLNLLPIESRVIENRNQGQFNGAQHYGDTYLNLFHDSKDKKFILPLKAKFEAKLKDVPTAFKMELSFLPSAILSGLKPELIKNFNLATNAVKKLDYNLQGFKNINIEKIGELSVTLNAKKVSKDIFFPPETPTIQEAPFKSAYFADMINYIKTPKDVQIYSALKRLDLISDFVAEINSAFPEIIGIDLIPYPDGSQGGVSLKTKDGNILPLQTFGDGLRRFFSLTGEMIVHRDSVHCIEEIDATFHPKAHQELIRLLVKYSQTFNNQIFITSHSIEFADNILASLYGPQGYLKDNSEELLQVYTLRKIDNDIIQIMSMTGAEAYKNREKFQIELRE